MTYKWCRSYVVCNIWIKPGFSLIHLHFLALVCLFFFFLLQDLDFQEKRAIFMKALHSEKIKAQQRNLTTILTVAFTDIKYQSKAATLKWKLISVYMQNLEWWENYMVVNEIYDIILLICHLGEWNWCHIFTMQWSPDFTAKLSSWSAPRGWSCWLWSMSLYEARWDSWNYSHQRCQRTARCVGKTMHTV